MSRLNHRAVSSDAMKLEELLNFQCVRQNTSQGAILLVKYYSNICNKISTKSGTIFQTLHIKLINLSIREYKMNKMFFTHFRSAGETVVFNSILTTFYIPYKSIKNK